MWISKSLFCIAEHWIRVHTSIILLIVYVWNMLLNKNSLIVICLMSLYRIHLWSLGIMVIEFKILKWEDRDQCIQGNWALKFFLSRCSFYTTSLHKCYLIWKLSFFTVGILLFFSVPKIFWVFITRINAYVILMKNNIFACLFYSRFEKLRSCMKNSLLYWKSFRCEVLFFNFVIFSTLGNLCYFSYWFIHFWGKRCFVSSTERITEWNTLRISAIETDIYRNSSCYYVRMHLILVEVIRILIESTLLAGPAKLISLALPLDLRSSTWPVDNFSISEVLKYFRLYSPSI